VLPFASYAYLCIAVTAQVHTLSVDEVQDLTPAQIMLLKFLCDDAEHGFLLAGDTAQTIAHGVNFRFQVHLLRWYQPCHGPWLANGILSPSVLTCHGKVCCKTVSMKHLPAEWLCLKPLTHVVTHVQDIRALFYDWFLGRAESEPQPPARGGSSAGPSVPDTFQLRQNYRTHMGVVRLAHSVVSAPRLFALRNVSCSATTF